MRVAFTFSIGILHAVYLLNTSSSLSTIALLRYDVFLRSHLFAHWSVPIYLYSNTMEEACCNCWALDMDKKQLYTNMILPEWFRGNFFEEHYLNQPVIIPSDFAIDMLENSTLIDILEAHTQSKLYVNPQAANKRQ